MDQRIAEEDPTEVLYAYDSFAAPYEYIIEKNKTSPAENAR